MRTYTSLIITILALIFTLPQTALSQTEVVEPFADGFYACLTYTYEDGESGTELVRYWGQNDYGRALRFNKVIRILTRRVRRLDRKITRLTNRGASEARIARLQARHDKFNGRLSGATACRDGGDTGGVSPTPTPTPNPGGGGGEENTGVPCAVVGDNSSLSAKIINGNQCTIGNSGVLELIMYNGNQEAGGCSGTAISSRAVLTAAHCLNEGVTSVQVKTGSGTFTATSFAYHSGYDPNGNYPNDEINDIGIVHVGVDLPVQIFGLLTSDDLVTGETMIIGGYGITESGNPDGLRAGYMTLAQKTDFGIVANYDGTYSNTCSGDSGGPVFVKRGDSWVIAGTTSWGQIQECTAGDESHFAKVSYASNLAFIGEQVPGI